MYAAILNYRLFGYILYFKTNIITHNGSGSGKKKKNSQQTYSAPCKNQNVASFWIEFTFIFYVDTIGFLLIWDIR